MFEELVERGELRGGDGRQLAALLPLQRLFEEIVAEALTATHSERENRIVDQGTDTMEDKKRDGYF